MVLLYSVLLNCLSVRRWCGHHLPWLQVVWCKLKYCWNLFQDVIGWYFLVEFLFNLVLLFVSLRCCCSFKLFACGFIFHLKASNFPVDILKVQGNKFLKINKFIRKTSIIAIVPPDIHVVTSITFGVSFIFVSVFACFFQSIDLLNYFSWFSVCFR